MSVRFDREDAAGGPVLQGFSGRGFRVDGVIHEDGVWLTPIWARGWRAPAIENLGANDLTELLSGSPEFLLLGTGPSLKRPTPAFVQSVEARGLGVEVMDSRAAARAWVVLRGEGRDIVGALLPL